MSETAKPEWATYAFCVLRRPEPPDLDGAPEALPGFRRLRTVALGESVWLIAADAPRREYDERAIHERLEDVEWVSRGAVAHEGVVEHFMTQGAVVPLKLFSLFDDDARAASYFDGIRRKLEVVLERVEGCQEWGLRVSLGSTRKRSLADRGSKLSSDREESGAGYLRRKQVALDRARRREELARAEAEALYSTLSGRAVACRRRSAVEAQPESRILVDAAFLVATPESESFETEVRSITEGLEDFGLSVQLTGPWPPYHFVEESA